MANEKATVPSQQNQANETGKLRSAIIVSAFGLLAAIVFGLLYLFVLAPSVPEANIGWYLFSFATGLTMIVLPCTLPLAFVIVPLSMGKGMARGIGMALAFGIGVAVTLSLYGIAAALLGGVAIDALGADLESIKNWVYFIAGAFALIFALSEIGLMNVHMPTYSGAAPAFIQKRGELIKAFLLGLFLGNVGVGCPHPATPLILIEIASSGDVLYGWSMFLIHAIGRILPLLLLAFLAILGINGLNWLMARKDAVERGTGWAMVFVAGFILTLGLFSHDWWVNSGLHSGLETITQESYFNALLNETLDQDVEHVHGLEDGTGLFGQPLWWGHWFLVAVWLIPIWWWYWKRSREIDDSGNLQARRVLSIKRNFLIVISIFLILIFAYFLPKNFYLASLSGGGHDDGHGDDHGGSAQDLEGIHVMSNGMVMNAAGDMFPDAEVLDDGSIKLKDGTVVEPGGSMRDMMTGTPFTKETAGLPEARGVELVTLTDGESYDITASYVQKEVGNRILRMLAYNGSVPGPIINVEQGSEITINFTNDTDVEQTIHSHGIRVDNRSDGVPYVTQDPVMPGESYTYTIRFDDAGVFWYHPHTREDYGQELGLYGNYFVDPAEEDYWNPVNREMPLVLDDILINNDKIESFYREYTNFALLGRFGNTHLVNGVEDYTRTVRAGEVVRFYITNVANTRVYNLSIPGAKIKRVGADLGRFERETFEESLLISPAERLVVEAYFPEAGTYKLMHTTPDSETELARFLALDEAPNVSYVENFNTLRSNSDVSEAFASFDQYRNAEPDKELLLTIDLPEGQVDHSQHAHMDHGSSDDMSDMDTAASEDRMSGIQWNDPGQSDRTNTTDTILWQLKDRATGKVNMDIDWTFQVDELVKVRLTNDADADHVMQHPIHFHGQRFVVLSENGERNDNLAWKDTVLVFPGETVDILVDMNNPGVWMSHCHIAEHLHAGMMLGFRVENEDGTAPGDEYRATVSEDERESHTAPDPAHMMEEMSDMHGADAEAEAPTPLPYDFSNDSVLSSDYQVHTETQFARVGVHQDIPLTFTDAQGELIDLNNEAAEPFSVTFVRSDNEVRFATKPGNTVFPGQEKFNTPDSPGFDESQPHEHGADDAHSFVPIKTAYADAGHGHSEAAATDTYSVPVIFPATGIYKAFVKFVPEGETQPVVSAFNIEVNSDTFSVDNFGWSDTLKWWILLVGSIILILPLVWGVRRYINAVEA